MPDSGDSFGALSSAGTHPVGSVDRESPAASPAADKPSAITIVKAKNTIAARNNPRIPILPSRSPS